MVVENSTENPLLIARLVQGMICQWLVRFQTGGQSKRRLNDTPFEQMRTAKNRSRNSEIGKRAQECNNYLPDWGCSVMP